MQDFPSRQTGKLNIYMHVSENSGVGYYRQYLPALKMREHNLANVLISDFRWGEGDHVEPSPQAMFPIANWADIIIVGRKDIKEFYAEWGGIREFFKLPILLDTDDNVHAVRPFNPGYQGYRPGSEALIWNNYAIEKTFDAITVTTQDLKDFYLKRNPRIYILPNSLDLIEWAKHERKQHAGLYIGFIASAAHSEGVMIIKKPIIEILKKYPQVKFFITHIYRHLLNDAPEEVKNRIESVPWIKLQDWPKGVKDLGLDIGLAPLADNMFNRAKSNLRWLEYSAAGMVSIVSPVKPYLCVRNNETGILAKESSEWYTAIEKLVLDENLRYTLAKNAYDDVFKNYNIDTNANRWANTYQEVHDKYHEFFGAKKVFEKLGKGKWLKVNK